jgi:hypothetical protein
METLGRTGVQPALKPVLRAVQRPEIRLTARGAVIGLFVVCFLSLLFASWTGWSAVADLGFVSGCAAAGWYTKRGALLAIAVSPPVIYFTACLIAEWLTSSGTFTLLEGIFVTLGTSAPWLFGGTALTLGITICRGLPSEIMDLFDDLRALWARLLRVAQLSWCGEGHPLLNRLDLGNVGEPVRGQGLQQLADQFLRHRGAAAHPYRSGAFQPGTVNLAGVINQVRGAGAGVLRHLNQAD